MTIQLIDSHAHIDGKSFNEDRSDVINRAREAGVGRIINIGNGDSLEQIAQANQLASQHEGIYSTCGVHPHDAKEIREEWWTALREMATFEKCVALGETGLDYHYDYSPRDVQQQAFARHIQLGKELDMPIVCHVRDAHADALRILEQENARECGAVIHCFTGGPEEAKAYVALGLYISFSGIVTFKGKSAQPIRDAVGEVPLDRILVETDSPYLAPVPNRGKRNEPAYVVHTAKQVAELKGIDYGELATASVENTQRFFRLPPGADNT